MIHLQGKIADMEDFLLPAGFSIEKGECIRQYANLNNFS